MSQLELRLALAQRKEMEDALRESKKLFHSLSESAPIGIITTNAYGKCTFANRRWQEISGLTVA